VLKSEGQEEGPLEVIKTVNLRKAYLTASRPWRSFTYAPGQGAMRHRLKRRWEDEAH